MVRNADQLVKNKFVYVSVGFVVSSATSVARFDDGVARPQVGRQGRGDWRGLLAVMPHRNAVRLALERREPSPDFAHGELTRRIHDALRENAVITSREVANRAMRDKGLDPETDPPTRTDFARRVTMALADMARKGKVDRIGKGRALRWRLAN